MKKTTTILMGMLLILSMVPFGFAENDTSATTNQDAVDTKAAPTLYNTAVDGQNTVFERLKKAMIDVKTVEECISKIEANFPNVKEKKNICERLIKAKKQLKTGNINAEEIKNKVQRFRDNERFQKIKESKAFQELKNNYKFKVSSFVKNHPELKEKVENLTQEELKKFALMKREKIKELSKENADLKDRLKEIKIKQVKIKDLYQKREIAKQRYNDAKQRYNDAVERYNKAKYRFLEAKKEFQDAVKAGDEEKAKELAKKYLTHGAEMVIESLKKIKENTASNDDLTEDEANEIISELDEKIEEMKSLKKGIENAETKEEIKKYAPKITNAWGRIKIVASVHAAKGFKSKVGEIFSRSQQLERRLENVLAKLEENGYDISDLETKLETFSEEIETSKETFLKAQEELKDLKEEIKEGNYTKEVADEMIKEIKDKIKQAHEDLKDAHKIIVELFKEAKQLDPNVSIEEDEEEIVEVIVEKNESDDGSDESDNDKDNGSENTNTTQTTDTNSTISE